MKLVFALLAEYAITLPDGKLSINGGDFDTVFASSFPAVHPKPTVLVARIQLEPEQVRDAEHEYQIQVEFLGPSGPVIPPFTMAFRPTANQPVPNRPMKFTLLFNLPALYFPAEGRYTFRLAADGQELGTIDVYAVVLAQSEASADTANR